MSKGSARRPGDIQPGVWEAIFAPRDVPEADCGNMPANLSIPAPKIDTSGECVDAVNVTDWSAG